MKPWITVFGSGRVPETHAAYRQAQQLGGLLARAGFGICTGGYRGVMEAAPRGAREEGGRTAAVIIGDSKSAPNPWIDAIHREDSWALRLAKLIDLGSGYVVMDGGVGTLNELFMVWEMGNKGLHQKPIVLLGETPASLKIFLKQNPLVEHHDRPRHAASPEEALAFLNEAL